MKELYTRYIEDIKVMKESDALDRVESIIATLLSTEVRATRVLTHVSRGVVTRVLLQSHDDEMFNFRIKPFYGFRQLPTPPQVPERGTAVERPLKVDLEGRTINVERLHLSNQPPYTGTQVFNLVSTIGTGR